MGTGEPGRRLGPWIPFAVLVLLAVLVHLRYGHLGFNPTDEGFLLSQARRVVQGTAPHTELISPRPLGSAVLHTADLAVPVATVELSRLLATLAVAMTALLAFRFATASPLARWGPAAVIATALAMLGNLNSFPMMAWHTIDGLLLTTAGLVLLDVSDADLRSRRTWIGMALLGATVTVKQSFVFVPLLGLAWVGHRLHRAGADGHARWRGLLAGAALAAIPGLLYLGWLLATGSLGAAWDQLTGAQGTDLRPSFEVFRDPLVTSTLLSLAAVLALWVVGTLLTRRAAGSVSPAVTVVTWVVLGAAALLWTRSLLAGGLAMAGPWGWQVFWVLLLVAVLGSLSARRFDVRAFAVAVIGWMISLSWGMPVPNLFAGTMAVVAAHRVWTWYRPLAGPPGPAAALPAVAGLLVALFVLPVFDTARTDHIYRDLPAARLDHPLGDVSPEFGRIRTSAVTGQYLAWIGDCAARYPASRTAVLPDNGFAEQVFGFDNPFPMTWMIPLEWGEEEERILEAARDLDRQGDYLVLFQTSRAAGLASLDELPMAELDSELVFGTDGLLAELRAELDGEEIVCGPFVGTYRPAG
jgi:hypothetical protein